MRRDEARARLSQRMEKATGWATLFDAAFKSSRNAMVLADSRRLILDVNGACIRLLGYSRDGMVGQPMWKFVDGGPLLTPEEWALRLATRQFTGEGRIITADDSVVAIHWGAVTEQVTGQRLVLLVALSTSRWGERLRREPTDVESPLRALSLREREIVHLVALGLTGPEIADELNISHDTVRTHVRNSMTKLNARSRAHLVAKALGEGHALP
jgi:PAS domain S-box-containing protein